MESMKKVGITGGIGAGKSFLGKMLVARGFRVLDADIAVHELYAHDKDLRDELAKAFGKECLTEDGVNRQFLSNVVFKDVQARERLESIVYPCLERKVTEFFDSPAESTNENYRFVEAAVLSRAPAIVEMLDEVWIVEAAEEVRLERLATRGLSREEALRRIDNQRGLFDPAQFNGKVVRIIVDKNVIDSLLK